MSSNEIKAVKKTWRLLQDIDPLLLGDVFYSRLFLDNPDLKRLFITSQEIQAKKLIDMLSLIVMKLNNLSLLLDDIKAMGGRHLEYGVQPIHYEQVGNALLWTLKTGLGNDWTPEAERAWTRCYQTIAQAMQEGEAT